MVIVTTHVLLDFTNGERIDTRPLLDRPKRGHDLSVAASSCPLAPPSWEPAAPCAGAAVRIRGIPSAPPTLASQSTRGDLGESAVLGDATSASEEQHPLAGGETPRRILNDDARTLVAAALTVETPF